MIVQAIVLDFGLSILSVTDAPPCYDPYILQLMKTNTRNQRSSMNNAPNKLHKLNNLQLSSLYQTSSMYRIISCPHLDSML